VGAVSCRNIATRRASNQRIYSAVKRLFYATFNSLRGMRYGFRTEAALREEAVLFVLALPLACFAAPDLPWFIAMVAVLLVLLAVEFLNTAIEKLSDHVTPEHHPEIGMIKDFGSAAVFCMIVLAGVVWLAALAVRFGFA
jgi:diacylglycerol kinase (ATP)